VNQRPFGKTGCTVSALGFGCMRFPMRDDKTVDRDRALPMLLKARELGVNYFDTGKWYCSQDSERTLGEALKKMRRSEVYVSTKYAMEHPTAADLREKFETSLRLLDLDYIDFYHFWGISWEQYETKLAIPGGPLAEFLKLKEEGLVRHLSFSFHSKPEDIRPLVDTGHFESMLCQYNLLDRANEEGIAYAASKGLGVVIMGPVGGGRLGAPSEVVAKMLDGRRAVSTPELALRFVLSNPGVSIALSGLSEMRHVEENCETASRATWLTDGEKRKVVQAAQENRKFMDLYCTGCKYCMPCPHEVNISRVFEAMNYLRVWGLEESARSMYRGIGKSQWDKGRQADACEECGECETKCPQKLPIMEQLKESHAALSR
jgi:predicted aldo/keto reductase-like oxidoreductase